MVAATALVEPDKSRCGRIGGIVAPRGRAISPASSDGLRTALGANAQLLADSGCIVDADACFLDGRRVLDFAAALPRLSEITGGFAVAWRERDGRVRLASDPIGQRRLYYAQLSNGVCVFASTLHGVLGSGLVPRRLARSVVAMFLTFAYVPSEQTLVEAVRALPPGVILELDPHGSVQMHPYWRLPSTPSQFAAESELREQLRQELTNAVARALPADPRAPVGCTLSGGIDSSLVVALARKLHAGPLITYSISFGGEHRNELPWSELVARHCGAARVIVEASARDVARELDSTVATLSQPNGDPLTVPNTLLFRRAASDTGFLLNGEGGDPCFGGPKNAPMLLAELLDDTGLSGVGASGDSSERARSYLRAHQKCYDDLPAMLRPDLAIELRAQAMERLVDEWLREPRWPSLLDKLMAINIAFKGAHHILPKVDQLSFASGLQPRSPLFDRRVVELSFAIPAGLKRCGAVEKYLLKEAVRDLLPHAILERPKSGMMVPVEAWFQGPLRAFATERLMEGLARWELIEPRWLQKLLAWRLPGLRPRHGVKLWLLLTLESWLRQVLHD